MEVEKALTTGADKVVQGARLRVPVDTGDLKDSITRTDVRVGKKGGLYVAITAGRPTDRGYNTARIVEFGTVDTPAQPFLLPAYRIYRKSNQARIKKAIKDALLKGK